MQDKATHNRPFPGTRIGGSFVHKENLVVLIKLV